MQPFFSVVIPTLNEELFVGGLLEDLGAQSFRSFEVIHVDGNSNDNTCAVVNSFSDKLPITSMQSGRRNLSFQRNLGSNHANGTYLIFVDADTRIPDIQFLKCIYNRALETGRHIYLPHAKFLGTRCTDTIAQYLNNTFVRLSQHTPRPLPTSGLAIFRRDCFTMLGGYTVTDKHDKKKLFVEDHEIMMRARKNNATSEYVRDTEFGFSLRRYKKDGWVQVMKAVIPLTIQMSFGAKTSDHTYEMGGHSYKTPML